MKGISVDLKRGDPSKELEVELILQGRIYIDTVIEIAPIRLSPGDRITVRFNLQVAAQVNGRTTSTVEERFAYTREIMDEVEVRYIRFVKFHDKALIDLSENLPGFLQSSACGYIRTFGLDPIPLEED